MGGFRNDTVYGNNADFSGATIPAEANGLFDDGDLWIGSTAVNAGGTHVNVGTIVGTGGISVNYVSPNIVISSSGGSTNIDSILTESGAPAVVPDGTGQVTFTGGDGIDVTGNGPGNTVTFAIDDETVGQTITGDTGGALSPTAGNWNIVSTATNGIETTGAGSTLTVAMATPYADGDFEFRSAVSGATRTLSVTNTSDTASSQSTFLHSVAGTSAGDTWSQFNVGSTRSYSLGIDNSESDILKITTDGDGTVDPSSGTHIAGFTTSATVEFGPEGSGTSNTNRTVAMRRDLNGGALYYADNQSTGNVAYAGYQAGSNGGDGLLVASVNTNYTDPEIAGKAYIHAIRGAGQGDLLFQGLTFRFIQDDGTDILANCTSLGAWTYRLQPSFAAYNSATDTNQTGAGALVTVQFDTELFDRGGNFAANTFTAPVSGIYYFDARVYCSGITAAMTAWSLDLVIAGNVATAKTFRVDTPNNLAQNRSVSISTYANMTANDTAIIQLQINNGVGNTANISGSASTGGLLMTTFSGKLVA